MKTFQMLSKPIVYRTFSSCATYYETFLAQKKTKKPLSVHLLTSYQFLPLPWIQRGHLWPGQERVRDRWTQRCPCPITAHCAHIEVPEVWDTNGCSCCMISWPNLSPCEPTVWPQHETANAANGPGGHTESDVVTSCVWFSVRSFRTCYSGTVLHSFWYVILLMMLYLLLFLKSRAQ